VLTADELERAARTASERARRGWLAQARR
jgi:hypothetical protein